jgi:hypothetical protein
VLPELQDCGAPLQVELLYTNVMTEAWAEHTKLAIYVAASIVWSNEAQKFTACE